MIATIKCPKCETVGKFSLVDPVYEGPYKCWKCREYFLIKMVNNKLKSCEPITEEEFNHQQEIQTLRTKFSKDDK